jgi:D-alanyl-D-alanine carboxypeptidase
MLSKNKKFTKEVNNLLKQYGATNNEFQTSFGMLTIRNVDCTNNLYSIFIYFKEDFDIKLFYKFFSESNTINPFSKKWNIHESDMGEALIELDARLHNLNDIYQKYGNLIK